jgi:hypothetical protein
MALISDQQINADGTEVHAEHTIEFIYSSKRSATRWSWTVEKEVWTKDGVKKVGMTPRTYASMLKYLSLYRVARVDRLGPGGSRTIEIIDPDRPRDEFESYAFDPMAYLSAGGCDLDEMLQTCSNSVKDPEIDDCSMSRNGDRVVVNVKHEGMSHRYTVDLAQGASVVAGGESDADGRRSWSCQWERLDRIWVPQEIVLEVRGSEQATFFRRKVKFVESVLNEPLQDNEFSLAKLGARNGDVVFDASANVRYVYHDAVEQEHSSNAVSSEISTNGRASILLNIAPWVILLATIALLRMRSSTGKR